MPEQVSLSSLTYRVSGGGLTPIMKSSTIAGSPKTTSTVFKGLPGGYEYSVTVSALATDGVTTCLASGKARVVPNRTAMITLPFQCTPPNGSAIITVGGFQCRLIPSLVIAPAVAAVGADIQVSADVDRLDGGAVGFAWTATSGTFGDRTAEATSFVCSTAGTVSITLTVTSGICGDHLTLPVSCVPPP